MAQVERYYVSVSLGEGLLKESVLVERPHCKQIVRVHYLCRLVGTFSGKADHLVDVGALVHYQCQSSQLPYSLEVRLD